ncbi:MAG: hypothetical protein ABIA74_03745 [bacterium]
MKIKLLKKITFFILFFILFPNLFSVPMNSYYDSAIFYDFKGTDKYYSKKKQPWFSFALSPYYQHSSGCRGLNGNRKDSDFKLGEGDRLGTWNMLGLFYGVQKSPNSSPVDKPYDLQFTGYNLRTDVGAGLYYQTLALANVVLDANANTQVASPPFTALENNDSQANSTATSPIPVLNTNFTDVDNFEESEYFGRVSVPIDFEKLGLRSKFNFDFFKWFGMNLKTGICYYHQDPTFNDKTSKQVVTDSSIILIQRYLTNEQKLKNILGEVNLDADSYSKTCMEDTHVEAYFNYPIHLSDEDGDHVMSFIPIFSIGVWAPTGAKKKEDYLFSLATGNDGYTGLTLQGSLNMDFPGTVQLAFGLGAAFFNHRELKNVHIP